MRLLRSEDGVPDGGAVMPLSQLQELARAWYGDRCDEDWRPRTREASQQVLRDAGLDGEFWQLAG